MVEGGECFAWGWNEYGQIGDGTHTNRRVLVKLGLAKVITVAAGWDHSLAGRRLFPRGVVVRSTGVAPPPLANRQ